MSILSMAVLSVFLTVAPVVAKSSLGLGRYRFYSSPRLATRCHLLSFHLYKAVSMN